MSSWTGKAAAQLELVNHLPHLAPLCQYQRLTVKVEDPSVVPVAIASAKNQSKRTFKPVRFIIRDESKTTVLVAELRCSIGFVITWNLPNETRELMRVTLPVKSENVLGKIQHPTGATLYKIYASDEPGHFAVDYEGAKRQRSNISLCRCKTRLLGMLHRFDFTYDDSDLTLRAGITPTAVIRPRYAIKRTTPTTVIKFVESDVGDPGEIRAIALGTALLLQLSIAHADLETSFQQTRKVF